MLENIPTDEIVSEMVVIIPQDLIGAGPLSEIETPSEDSFLALVGEDFATALAIVRGQVVDLVGCKEETKETILRLEDEVARLETMVINLQDENEVLKKQVEGLDEEIQKQAKSYQACVKEIVAGIQHMLMAEMEKMVSEERTVRKEAEAKFDEELAKERQLCLVDREALIEAIMHKVSFVMFLF